MKKTIIILSILVAVTASGLFVVTKLDPSVGDKIIRPIVFLSKSNQTPEQRLEDIQKYVVKNVQSKAKKGGSFLHNKGLLKKDVTLIFQKPLIDLLSGGTQGGITKAVTQIQLESLYDHTNWSLPKSDSKVSANITLDLDPSVGLESPVQAQADFDTIIHGESIFMKLRDIQSNYPEFEVSLTELEKNGLALRNQWVDMLESASTDGTPTLDPEKVRAMAQENFQKNFLPATTLYTPTTAEKNEDWFIYTYDMSPEELDGAVKGFLADMANPLANEMYPGDDDMNMALRSQIESTLLGLAQGLDLTAIEKAQLVFKSHVSDLEKWNIDLTLSTAQGMMLSLNVGNDEFYQGSLLAGMSTDGMTVDQPMGTMNWSQQEELFTLMVTSGPVIAELTVDNQEEQKEAALSFMGQPVFNLMLTPSGYEEFWNIDAKVMSGGQTIGMLAWAVTDESFLGNAGMISPFGINQGFELAGTHEEGGLEANLSMVMGEEKESIGTLSLMKQGADMWSGVLTAIPTTKVMINNFKFDAEDLSTEWDIDLTVLESDIELGQVMSKGSWVPKNTINITPPLNTIPLSQFMEEFEANNGAELIDFNFTPSPKNEEGTSPYYDPNDIETLLEQMDEYEESGSMN